MIDKHYANIAGALSVLDSFLKEGSKYNLNTLYDQCKNGFKDVPNPENYPQLDRIEGYIVSVKKVFDNFCIPNASANNTVSKDQPIWDELNDMIKEYKLGNIEQLIQKLKMLRYSEKVVIQLMVIVNSVFPNQVNDMNSLFTFVNELIKQFANMKEIQQNSDVLCMNMNAILSENATLKAQNEQLKQQLAALQGNV